MIPLSIIDAAIAHEAAATDTPTEEEDEVAHWAARASALCRTLGAHEQKEIRRITWTFLAVRKGGPYAARMMANAAFLAALNFS